VPGRGVAALLCVAVLIFGTAAGRASASDRSFDAGVLARLNAIRAAHSLRPLRSDAPLTRAARAHSQEMVVDGYFSHSSANGSVFWKRVERYYGHGDVGENLLWASPTVSAQRAVALWMASPEHRANILQPLWRQIGIGVAHAASAPGWFGGRAVTVVTTDFGTPS